MLMATRKLFSTLDYLNAKVPKVMQAEGKINLLHMWETQI